MTTVVHVIRVLDGGGPSNALMTAAAGSAAEARLDHTVVSLGTPDPDAVKQARERGLTVRDTPDLRSLSAVLVAADIVQIHFWNHPALYQLLGAALPETRLLLWSHIAGEHPPQMLPAELLGFADVVLASCEHTTTLAGLERLDWIPAVAGWDRVQEVRRNVAREFTVGYLGKLDFAKLHPEFITLCGSIGLPRARFLVCGEGGALPLLRRQAAARGIARQIEFRGLVRDVRSAFADMDVFGYPLAPDTSAASELALQEAMYVGVPPVVLGPAAVRQHIIDGETGILAGSGEEYAHAIAYLYHHPEERARIGRAAHDFAARTWSPNAIAGRWAHAYEELARQPKRKRAPFRLADSGAGRFIQSLVVSAPQFVLSMTATGEDARAADEEIACSPDVLCTANGGIFNYRDFYPDDPYLRLWSGLVLRRQGRVAVAAGEFAAAIRLGLDDLRTTRYLTAAAREARAGEVTQQELLSAL
jgi:glycosyltransferase involved in cell wall biosynthesis